MVSRQFSGKNKTDGWIDKRSPIYRVGSTKFTMVKNTTLASLESL